MERTNMPQLKVYLAGPITGESYRDAVSWRENITNLLKPEIKCFSPLRGKSYLGESTSIQDHYENFSLSSGRGIYTRDKWDATRCDILFANFLNAKKVSIGTVLEIAWADSKNIPIIIVMEEDNIHQHSMLRECAGYIVPTLEEGINILKALS